MDNTLTYIIETVTGLLLTLAWWMWRSDRYDQNARIASLEERMSENDQDRITREEFNGVAASIRTEFRDEHSKIIVELRSTTEAIRSEMRECNKAITDRIDRLIEAKR